MLAEQESGGVWVGRGEYFELIWIFKNIKNIINVLKYFDLKVKVKSVGGTRKRGSLGR